MRICVRHGGCNETVALEVLHISYNSQYRGLGFEFQGNALGGMLLGVIPGINKKRSDQICRDAVKNGYAILDGSEFPCFKWSTELDAERQRREARETAAKCSARERGRQEKKAAPDGAPRHSTGPIISIVR